MKPSNGRRGRIPGARTKRAMEVAEAAKRYTMSPLDVMLTAMEKSVKRAQNAERARDEDKSLAAWANAHNYAKDAAPYLHSKIQAVTISGDPNNPLTTLNLHVNKEQFAELAQQLLIEG